MDHSMDSTRLVTEPTYLQLQYSQTVMLVFNGVFWPHITVATMHLSNGWERMSVPGRRPQVRRERYAD